jgi:hypothetical protein
MFNGISGVTSAEDVWPGVSRNSLASHRVCKVRPAPQAGLRPSGA